MDNTISKGHLEDYISTKQPLGPHYHEYVESDIGSSTRLLSNVRPLEAVFKNQSSIIIGRRGSGKTAAMMAYRSFATYGRFYGRISDQQLDKRGINISVVDWGHFHEMVRNVASKSAAEVKFDHTRDFLWSERVAEIWSEELWDLIYRTFYRASLDDKEISCMIPSVKMLYNTEDIVPEGANLLKQKIEKLYAQAKDEIINCLKKLDRKCLILIDTMEEYPIRNPLFERVISGFLKCVTNFSSPSKNIKIVFCIPAELEYFFKEASSNPLKDFGDATRLDWKPSDLLKVVAERYRLYVNLHGDDNAKRFIEDINNKDFSTRDNIQWLFGEILEKKLINRFGVEEDTMAYIIRHTQLAPREFIVILNDAIKLSIDLNNDVDKANKSMRWISSAAVVKAIDRQEEGLGDLILQPFNKVYPRFLESCEEILPDLPVFCTAGDVSKIQQRFKGRAEDDVGDLATALFRLGVLGYVDSTHLEQTSPDNRYVYGYFRFNSPRKISVGNDRLYCVHPLFSRRWSMTRKPEFKDRFVYPANIEHFRML